MSQHDDFRHLTEEQHQRITDNILASEVVLDDLLVSVTEHLKSNNASCVRCCVGASAGETLSNLYDQEAGLFMVLTVALRRLAEQEYEKSVKV